MAGTRLSDLMAMAAQWLDPIGCVDDSVGCADIAGQGLNGVDLIDYSALAASWLNFSGILSSRNDATPPMTMPPGNQTWNWLSFLVF